MEPLQTLLIDASPKKRFSNSAYFMGFAKLFIPNRFHKTETAKLPLNTKYQDIFEKIKHADQVILATPLYVDGIPSHVLCFLQALEKFTKEHQIQFKLYVIANCGFFEGHQTKHLMAQVQTWCDRTGIEWGGGVGIGAGEMLGFLRITPFIRLAIAIIALLISFVIQVLTGNISFSVLMEQLGLKSLIIGIGISTSVAVFFSLLAAFVLIKLAFHVKRGRNMDIVYATVFCPKFMFTFFATIYWFLRLCILNLKSPFSAFRREGDYDFKTHYLKYTK